MIPQMSTKLEGNYPPIIDVWVAFPSRIEKLLRILILPSVQQLEEKKTRPGQQRQEFYSEYRLWVEISYAAGGGV
jgi:hypothetical protein